MGNKIGRNTLCYCGSGKKYKKCCLQKEEKEKEERFWFQNFFNRVQKGEIPLTAQVIGNGGSMKIGKSSIYKNGKEQVVLDEMIEITSKTTETNQKPSTTLSIYSNNKKSYGMIIGEGSIGEKGKKYKIIFPKKIVKVSQSLNNLWAKISIGRDENHINIIFGEKGKEEKKIDGEKNRPHISFYIEGNSKFVRLSNYKCQMKTLMKYDFQNKLLYPNSIEIILDDYNESLVLSFMFKNNEIVELLSAKFK